MQGTSQPMPSCKCNNGCSHRMHLLPPHLKGDVVGADTLRRDALHAFCAGSEVAPHNPLLRQCKQQVGWERWCKAQARVGSKLGRKAGTQPPAMPGFGHLVRTCSTVLQGQMPP